MLKPCLTLLFLLTSSPVWATSVYSIDLTLEYRSYVYQDIHVWDDSDVPAFQGDLDAKDDVWGLKRLFGGLVTGDRLRFSGTFRSGWFYGPHADSDGFSRNCSIGGYDCNSANDYFGDVFVSDTQISYGNDSGPLMSIFGGTRVGDTIAANISGYAGDHQFGDGWGAYWENARATFLVVGAQVQAHGTGSVPSVPAPPALALLPVALGALGLARRRRRKPRRC